MESKKSKKADLESWKGIFFSIGLVIALVAALIAFEWTTPTPVVEGGLVDMSEVAEEEMVPVTRHEEPPKKLEVPKIALDQIEIVDDEVELEEELEILDTEMDPDEAIDIKPVIQGEKEVDEAKIFVAVQDPPEFPGGNDMISVWIHSQVKYPVIAQENGVEGTVFVNFVVEPDGSVGQAYVMRPVDPALDKEALRVINAMPKWKPGRQNDRAVRVSFTARIKFYLQK